MLSENLEWIVSDRLIAYPEAVDFMEQRVADIRAGNEPEAVWLLEHPPLYTAGTSAKSGDLLQPDRFPVYESGRGGQYTYHGPGQRVAYVMLDLQKRGRDVRCYVRDLENWVVRTLASFGVKGEIRDGRVGIWVDRGPGLNGSRREDKIGAIGVRVRHWITFHGISLNIDPDLSHFTGIVPCGITQYGVTSLWDLGHTPTVAEVDMALKHCFHEQFGKIRSCV